MLCDIPNKEGKAWKMARIYQNWEVASLSTDFISFLGAAFCISSGRS